MQKDIDYSRFKNLEEAYEAGYNQGIQDKRVETIQIQISEVQRSLDCAKLTAQTNCALNAMNIIANESIGSSPSTLYQKQVIKQNGWSRTMIDKLLH